ncbi:MFS transporter, partial [Salmonella enterica]|uniref:MFS transporter n=1 Tax=Salmonella enterica TaxID=28901 RepID=UPI00398C3B8B
CASLFHRFQSWSGVAGSFVGGCCAVGSVSAGYVSKRFCGTKSLLVSALLLTISAVGTSISYTFTHFVIYRIIVGLAVGLAATVSPMYMSEVSPTNMRGRALSMQQFAIVFGQILIFYVNFKIASNSKETLPIVLGWRSMFAV